MKRARDGVWRLGVDDDSGTCRGGVFFTRFGMGEHGDAEEAYIGGKRRPKPTPIGDKLSKFDGIRFEIKLFVSTQIRLGSLGKKGEERGKEVRRKSGRF